MAAEKDSLTKELVQLEFDIHPFIIFCRHLENITKAYVIVNGDHYEYKNPLEAVDHCFRACVALHTWSKQLINIWAFVQRYIYQIEIGLSAALVFSSRKVVDSFKEKIDKLEKSGTKNS